MQATADQQEARFFDALILGQGLAGSTLAWQLLRRNWRVLVLDPAEAVTSSRIAAGLLTPITGQRCVRLEKFEELLTSAADFYRSVEREVGVSFFHQTGQVRLFQHNKERELFRRRVAESPNFAEGVREFSISPYPTDYSSAHGGYEMLQAAQLNVPAYLDASRLAFEVCKSYQTARIEAEEIVLRNQGVEIPRLQLRARRVIFCRGAEDRHHPWFQQIRFLPAKGEILTIRTDCRFPQAVSSRVWMAPTTEAGIFRVGSTYEWNQLDALPTEPARMELMEKLQEFLRPVPEIIRQEAAIRPALHDQKPVIGLHPDYPMVGMFNGLGSKGSLWGPWLAEQLTNFLCDGKPLIEEFDLRKKYFV